MRTARLLTVSHSIWRGRCLPNYPLDADPPLDAERSPPMQTPLLFRPPLNRLTGGKNRRIPGGFLHFMFLGLPTEFLDPLLDRNKKWQCKKVYPNNSTAATTTCTVHFINGYFHVFVVYVYVLYCFVLLCKQSQLFWITSKTSFLQKTPDVSNDMKVAEFPKLALIHGIPFSLLI